MPENLLFSVLKNKEDLFHLIKALSRSEKRYFTLDAQKSGRKGSKYLELFQAINEQEDYDEAALKQQFGANLPSDKAYLYEAILRSMRDYHSARSLAARIKELMLDARFLYERGLLEQTERRLDEAHDLARELDDHLALLEINMQQRHVVKSLRRKTHQTQLQNLIQAKNESLAAVNEELELIDTADRLFVEILQHFELKKDADKQALQLRFARLAQMPQPASSSRSLWRYLLCMAMYHQLLGNFDRVFHYYSQVVDWWDQHPRYKQEAFFLYIIDVSNLLHAYSVKGQYHRIPGILDRLEQEQPDSSHTQSLLFQKSAVYRLMYLINMGVSEGVDRFVAEMEKGLDKHDIKAGTRNALMANVAILLFVQGRFRACAQWAQKIIKDKTGPRADIRHGAWVLQLLAAFEYADEDFLESLIRATDRYFAKAGLKNRDSFEYATLDFAKRLAQASPWEAKTILREWLVYLEQLRCTGRAAMGLDELSEYWVRSRLDKIPVLEQIRRQRQRAEAGG